MEAGQVFMARARDGITPIWGVIWKPSTFDSTRKYPVIDHIYPGPLISPAVKYFFPAREAFNYPMFGQVQALAELGFVVVSIDAIGNTGRAKALNTLWYGNMGDNGIPDHVAAIEELASRMPQLDLDRVGIYGHPGRLRRPPTRCSAIPISTRSRCRHRGITTIAPTTAAGRAVPGILVRDTLRKTDN
jgi:hypothetical protein